MERLEVKSFGPIKSADVTFGDLTVLVGPQASGKSLFVQLLKAVRDAGSIRRDLRDHGFAWLHGKDPAQAYCSLYFGGGLQHLVRPETRIRWDGKTVDFDGIVKPGGRRQPEESTFLIPAQRALVLQDGWPKPFMGYSVGDPYAMRRFSDSLRLFLENDHGATDGKAIFPGERRLKDELQTAVNDAIYVGAKLVTQTDDLHKRIMLAPREGAPALPFTAWSTGQREFTPLLLGLYCLLPPTKQRHGDLRTVIIEEPELGLHPKAIASVGLLVLELLSRGYQVVLSTHSPVILDLVWAMGELKRISRKSAVSALIQIFDLERPSDQIKKILAAALTKEYRTTFFDRQRGGVITRDISSLDPGDPDDDVAGWGGLTGLSGRITQIVGRTVFGGTP